MSNESLRVILLSSVTVVLLLLTTSGVLEGVELTIDLTGTGLDILDGGLEILLMGGPIVRSQTDISGAG